MPRIFGDRIMLREFRASDKSSLMEWVNDPDVVGTLSDSFLLPKSDSAIESWIKGNMERDSDKEAHFVVADRETERYIGQIDFHVIDWKNRSARIGLVIGAPWARGKGYGSEALRTLIDYAFRFMNLHRVDLLVREDNLSARRCYEKCGFVEEGRMRQAIYRDGRYLDMIVMSVLSEKRTTAIV